MSRSTKTSADKTKQPPADKALPEAELGKVTGGAVKTTDFQFIKKYDKSSPILS